MKNILLSIWGLCIFISKVFGIDLTVSPKSVLIDTCPNQYTIWETVHHPIEAKYGLIGISYRRKEIIPPYEYEWLALAYSSDGYTWTRDRKINPYSGYDYAGRYPEISITPDYAVVTWAAQLSGTWGKPTMNVKNRGTGNWFGDNFLCSDIDIFACNCWWMRDDTVVVLSHGYQDGSGFTYSQLFKPSDMSSLSELRPAFSGEDAVPCGSDKWGEKIGSFYKIQGTMGFGGKIKWIESTDGIHWSSSDIVGTTPPPEPFPEPDYPEMMLAWYEFGGGVGSGLMTPGSPTYFISVDKYEMDTLSLIYFCGTNIYMLKGGSYVPLTEDAGLENPIFRDFVNVAVNRSTGDIALIYQECTEPDFFPINRYGYWDIMEMSFADGEWYSPVNLSNTPGYNDNLPHIAREIVNDTIHILYGASTDGEADLLWKSGRGRADYILPEAEEVETFLYYMKVKAPHIHGVEEAKTGTRHKAIGISIYPNPVYKKAVIRYGGIGFQPVGKHSQDGCATITIFDMTGRKIKEWGLDSGIHTLKFDTSDWSTGIYFVKSSNSKRITKFVVIH